jgi:beta-mannosidase
MRCTLLQEKEWSKMMLLVLVMPINLMMKKFGRLWVFGSRFFLPYLLVLVFSCSIPEEPLPVSLEKELNTAWQFRKQGKSDWQPATVPGTVHTDLMAIGAIGDPFYGNKEVELQWIENENWEYQCTFSLEPVWLNMDVIDLHLDGLDTYAKVYLNDTLVITANNMFVPWHVKVNDLLKAGANELRVVFESPVNRHRGQSEQLGYRLPCDNDSTHTAPFVRKAAYHFGWDWAPRFVTSGIYKPVVLKAWNSAQITDVFVEQLSLNSDTAHLRAFIDVEIAVAGEYQFRIGGNANTINLGVGKHQSIIDFKIVNPQLWQPNGSGVPYLYYLRATVSQTDELLSEKDVRVGLRNIRLVNEPDEIGTSFYFEVNGQPLFAKGANYIPQDVFLPRVKPRQYRDLLIASRDAGMNMMRVWGGGIYEQDLFYQLCDSLGIMVWQDFMFAGTAYPADSSFIENVKHEITYQCKRLRKHPSLALWCGNNEIEVAWKNWGWQQKYEYSPEDSASIWSNQLKLFQSILPEIVQQQSPNIAYVPTSPQSNWGKAENFNHGSMHYWGVWHGREPIENFKTNVGRFMVEYGMQSYPAWQTLQEYIKPEDLTLGSPALLSRQKSYIGNGEIERHMRDLGLEYTDLKSYVESSHRVQAEALRVAIDAHLNSNGHCMGTLFWQLNDCWPGPSWSVIDYRGRKKTGYEVVKELFTRKSSK